MLPHNLITFLQKNSEKDFYSSQGEIRKFKFYSELEIEIKEFELSSYELHLNGPLEHDPEEEIIYKGYNLIKSCNGYNSEGLLVYFTDLESYGTHDPDHALITLYNEKNWSKISLNLPLFINAQWYPEKIEHTVLNPWNK